METQKAGSPSGCCRSSMVHLEALSGGLSGSVPEKGRCGAGDEGDCKETPTSLRRTQSESQCHKLTGHRRTLEACSTGKQQWKMEFSSDLYDSVLIEKKLEDLRRARRNNDVRQMMFLLRSGLFRNLGNIGNPLLYEYCNVGTKRLIEKYIDEVVYQLNQLADADWPGVTLADLVDFFRDTRQAFGRSALLLSGGGAFGPYHIGVCKALFQHNLLPRIVAGSSVGSIVAGCICCKTDSELNEMLAHPIEMNAFDELDSDYPLLRKFKRLFQEGVLADVGPLREAVIKFVGDMTFQEAYNKTRRILNITVNSANPHESARLLNFLTAPHVVIWSAICASCALPGLFKPVQLLAKDKNGKLVNWGLSGEQWTDGSVETDLPTTRLSELFNVNHFIVCQINPHVLPFMHPRSPLSALSLHYPRTAELLVQELRHRATQLAQVHNAFRPVRDVLNQKYTGHITIVPDIHFTDYPKIISSPEPEYMKRAILLEIGMMRIHCDIELTLDRIFFRLQQRAFDQDNSLAQQDFVPDPARIARAQQRHASCVH